MCLILGCQQYDHLLNIISTVEFDRVQSAADTQALGDNLSFGAIGLGRRMGNSVNPPGAVLVLDAHRASSAPIYFSKLATLIPGDRSPGPSQRAPVRSAESLKVRESDCPL